MNTRLLALLTPIVFLALSQIAQAQFAVGATGDIRIGADKVDNVNGVTVLTGQVDIKQGDVRLLADKVEIFSNGSSGNTLVSANDINRMIATGNFYYVTPEQEVRGDKGVYTSETDSFVVTGNVILLQDDSVVTGSRLDYNLQTRDAKVTSNCKGRKCQKRDLQRVWRRIILAKLIAGALL